MLYEILIEAVCLVFWAVVSIFWAELIRDVWHIACHYNSTLYRTFHRWHHIPYEVDFLVRSEKNWRLSQWRHGLPEAILMILGVLSLWVGMQFMIKSWCIVGMLAGLSYSLREMFFVVLHGLGLAKSTDHLHTAGLSELPPTQWSVNKAYHWRHHFENSLAYFGAVYTLIDQCLGTALAFKRKQVAVTNLASSLGLALAEQLEREGATVVEALPGTSLDAIDILVILDADCAWLISPFLKTVHTNRDIACKECWCVDSSLTEATLSTSVKQMAPCTIRNIRILTPIGTPASEVVKQILFQSKRHVKGILVAQDPLLTLLYRLSLMTNGLWIKYAKRYQQPDTALIGSCIE